MLKLWGFFAAYVASKCSTKYTCIHEEILTLLSADYVDVVVSFAVPLWLFFRCLVLLITCEFGLMQWVIEISDNPGREEPEPAFKVS